MACGEGEDEYNESGRIGEIQGHRGNGEGDIGNRINGGGGGDLGKDGDGNWVAQAHAMHGGGRGEGGNSFRSS